MAGGASHAAGSARSSCRFEKFVSTSLGALNTNFTKEHELRRPTGKMNPPHSLEILRSGLCLALDLALRLGSATKTKCGIKCETRELGKRELRLHAAIRHLPSCFEAPRRLWSRQAAENQFLWISCQSVDFGSWYLSDTHRH
jgi:hypothetical protein